jgi:hypothetical protein
VDDFHDQLPGRDAREQILADRARLDGLQEVARDVQVHVGFEEDAPDLP